MPRPISSRMTKALRPRLVQDRRGLDHLDHEGRAAARQIVGGADPAEQAVDDADPGRAGRHVGAHLRQDRDQRVLPQKGALAGHVGTGDEPDPVVAPRRSHWRRTRRRYLRRRAPPRPSGDARREISNAVPSSTTGRTQPHFRRELGERRREIEGGKCRRGGGDLGAARHHLADEILVEAQFERQGPLGGAGDLGFELGQLGRRVALRPGHRLAVDELRPELAGMVGRHLDVIADHVVVADLQSRDRGLARRSAPAARRSCAGSRRAGCATRRARPNSRRR